MTGTAKFSLPPAGRRFIKMQGLRNHFVIVDARSEPFEPSESDVVRLCDVQIGVGCDQLVTLQPPTAAGKDKGAAAYMRFHNVDGKVAESCGNATRCVAWLLMQEQGSDDVILETVTGLIPCKKTALLQVSCVMGPVSMGWQDVPLASERDTLHLRLPYPPLDDAVALSIGNPHVVFFVPDHDAIDIGTIAPAIQQDALFPRQVNVGVAQILSDDNMRLTVYERGAGLTAACGTGACVAVYAARARGLTQQSKMTVHLPAGSVDIEISADGIATMTGPVAFSFSGYFEQ